MILSKTQFLNRFTEAEKTAILVAGDQYPSVKLYLFELQNAADVDICFPQTIEAVNGLETAGLIGSGRAAEILDVPTGDGKHNLKLVSGTTFICTRCSQPIGFSALGEGEPSVDANGNPPENPEQWMGACNA